jgi:replicative DNA helicase Mcm
MQSTVTAWQDFLKQVYWEEILELARMFPARKSIVIEYKAIEKFDGDLAEELINDPHTVLMHADEALRGVDLPAPVELEGVIVRIAGLPELTPIRELRSEHIEKLIAVAGLIRKATEVRPDLTQAAFKCQRCDHVTHVFQAGDKFVEPFECENEVCGRKGPFKFLKKESTYEDMQKIRLQESPEELRGGQQQQTLDVRITGELVGKVSPGDHVVVTGILDTYQRTSKEGKSTAMDFIFKLNSLQIVEKGFDEVEITPDDETRILELSRDPEIYNKITKSIAPSIYGNEDVKEAMALQLVGGLPKHLPDGTYIRGDIHILKVGDPGVAKSQMLRYQRNLAPRGIYVSGKTSSAAGLTATATKDDFAEGRWTIEAGALVLADMGLACADELDKMSDDDRSALHEAMEQQTVTVAKAGIVTTLKSRCALLGAANPKDGRFDRYEPLGKQIDMQPALLSRFDLIFILTDEPRNDRDMAIANHIFKSHKAGELLQRKEKIVSSGITDEQVAEAIKPIQPVLEAEFLRKYIAYARNLVFPLIEPGAEAALTAFYLSMRKQGEDPNAPLPITARQLEALIRFGEASARLILSDRVTEEDARRVIRLVMASLKQVYLDPETGRIDSDIINVGMGKSQRDRVKLVREIIANLQDEHKGAAPLEDIASKAKDSGLEKDVVEDTILRLKTEGDILEVSNKRYRVI